MAKYVNSDNLAYYNNKIKALLNGKSNINHTHNYAGSSSAGGAANSAVKLATARYIFGNSFDGSGNVAGHGRFYGTYTSTASDRCFNGGLEIRENGLVEKTQSDIGYAPTIGFHWAGRISAALLFHNDGNFYFRKGDGTSRATIDANVNGNASTASKWATARTLSLTGSVTGSGSIDGSGNVSIATTTNHSHNYAGSSSAGGSANSVANSLTVQFNGTTKATFNGSAAKTVNITPSAIGAATSGHTHNLNTMINTLETGPNTPVDADYYISQAVGGGSTNTKYYRRPVSALWNYMKGKGDSVYAAKSHTHNYAGSSSAGGAATNVYETLTNPSSYATYYIPFNSGASTGNKSLLLNDGLQYYTKEGTTSAVGEAQLGVGNKIASGTAGNKRGKIYMYGTSSGYTTIVPGYNSTESVTITLPSSDGTLSLDGHTHSSCNKGTFGTGAIRNISYGTAAPSGTATNGDIYIQYTA